MFNLARALNLAARGGPSGTAGAAQAISRTLTAKSLVYDKPGEPLDVLRLVEASLPDDVPEGQVLVKFLASPINPSDVNTVQGKYPLQPPLPGGVPGHEGVAQVIRVGQKVSGLQEGDWVVPGRSALGTWRSAALLAASDLTRAPAGLSVQQAATICINPPTALGMLETFVPLQPGDVVIQNGATSAVGQAVIQIAAAKGIKTVNVVRERPNMDETVSSLRALGASLVTTEARLASDLKASGLPAPALALNCVGGSAALAVTKPLRPGGVMVTYGGMSQQPVSIPTSLLIFKDISFRGFWVSGRWSQQLGPEGRAAVLERCAEYIRSGKLHTTYREFPITAYREAFAEVDRAHRGHKVLLTFT